MNLSNFDLNLLVVFDAIYKEKNLTRAGQKLHLSQPAISHALNRLRTIFDNRLFVRHGHLMEPTPLSAELRPNIKQILELAEITLEDRGIFDPKRSQHVFHIGIQDHPMLVVLPLLMKKIRETAPTINVKTSHLKKEDRKVALEEGNLDMVIGVKQEFGSNIQQQYLFGDREVCIVRKNHPEIKDSISLDQYINSEFIGLLVSEFEDQAIDAKLTKMGYKRNISLMVENEVTMPQLVANTDFLANIAVRVANEFIPWLPIKILSIPVSIQDFEFFQYWNVRHQKDPAHTWLRKTVKSVCDNLRPDTI
jgi:DNA-binding transcriptional LysR family regulator